MKKIKIAILAIVMALSCVFFAGCSSVDGTYNLKTMSYNGLTYTVGEKTLLGIEISEDFATLTINSDGTYSVKVSTLSISNAGYWKKEKKTYYLYSSAEDRDAGDTSKSTGTFTKSGKTISFEENGLTLTMTKA